jgi:hypothetical protein
MNGLLMRVDYPVRQIDHGDHTDDSFTRHDRQVTHMVRCHQPDAFIDTRLGVDLVHGLTHDLVHVASGEIDHPATVLAIWHEQRCRLLKMDIGIGNEGRGSHKIRF